MRKYGYFFAVIFLLLPLSLLAENKDKKEDDGLRPQIQIINLLNNLELTSEQEGLILDKAIKAQALRNDTKDKISELNNNQLENYKIIKDEVGSGKVVIDKQAANSFRNAKKESELILSDADKKIEDFCSAIESRLEPFQLSALDSYKPCIIPILQKGRIGQSDPSTGVDKVLEKVRNATEANYAKNRDRFVDGLVEKVKAKAAGKAEFDEVKIRNTVLETFEEVRSLDSAHFLVNREAIACKLADDIFPVKNDLTRQQKIKRFLLSEQIIPVLKEKLEKEKTAKENKD